MPKTEDTQIGSRKLKALATASRNAYRDKRRISDAVRDQLRSAAMRENLHLKAFNTVMAEDRMEPGKLADFYDAQGYYRAELGLIERAKSAPRLPIEHERGDNVVDLPAAE